MAAEALTLTVGIATRNRPKVLVRCLESIALIKDLVTAIPGVWRTRKPTRWASIRWWRRLRRAWPAFESRPARPA